MIDVHKSNDLRMGFFPTTILKNLDMHARRIVLAEMRSDLDCIVGHCIVPDKSTDETDDDGWRRCIRVGCTDRACRVRESRGRDEVKDERKALDWSANIITHNLVNHKNEDGCFPSENESLNSRNQVVFYTLLSDAIHEFFRHRTEVYRQRLWEWFRVGRTCHVSSSLMDAGTSAIIRNMSFVEPTL